MPLNIVGELWIAGANVSNGYWDQDEENAKHFSIDSLKESGSYE